MPPDPTTRKGSPPIRVASSISQNRQRQIFALLLAALALLSLASLGTFVRPVGGMPPSSTGNARGPGRVALSYGLVWAFGRYAAFGFPVLALAWSWNRV